MYLPRVGPHRKLRARSRPLPQPAQGKEPVLLVEDEAPLRSLVRDTLQSSGYKVLEAEDAEHALAILEGYPNPIDMVLTDVVMPQALQSLTVSMTCSPTEARSSSAYHMTRQPLPPTPSPVGGSRSALILPSLPAVAHPCRHRRQQQLPYPRLEDRTSKPNLQQFWAHGNGCSLPQRRFQMESHRAPPVLRNLQKLGRRAS